MADNDNNGLIFKEVRPVKLDFSATNFKAKVTGWRLSIEKKAKTLFPAVCDTARGIAGIIAATVDSNYELGDPQILARANLTSEDEDGATEHKMDNTQVSEHHDNGHHDNEVDNSNDGVDEDNGNGRVDEDDENGRVVEDDGNGGVDEDDKSGRVDEDNGADEPEDHKNGGDDSDDLAYTDEIEVSHEEDADSVLSEIVLSSDLESR